MSDSSSSASQGLEDAGPIDALERGLDVLLAAEVTRDVAAAIDLEQLRAGASMAEAVDLADLGAAIGRPAGRLVVEEVSRGRLGGGVAGLVAREVASRGGATVVQAALERVDAEAIDEWVGPSVREQMLETVAQVRAESGAVGVGDVSAGDVADGSVPDGDG